MLGQGGGEDGQPVSRKWLVINGPGGRPAGRKEAGGGGLNQENVARNMIIKMMFFN